jgi:hypothetical protein
MAKQIQGSCNRCGHCGCFSVPGWPEKWCPGLPIEILDWYLRYPDPDVQKFAAYFINRMGYTRGMRGARHFSMPGIGRVDYFLSDAGIQKSETDRSCPFLESTVQATMTGTTFTATSVTGSSTAVASVDNLAVASGGSAGVISSVAPNTLGIYGWLGGTPADVEIVTVLFNECVIFNEDYIPLPCRDYPQLLSDEEAAEWETNHVTTGSGGTCGFWWVDV